MKTQLRSLLIFLCVLLFPMSAFANLEIKSENIIFYGDVKPADGERLVRNLEIYRATILAFSKVDNRPDKTPLTIYAFKNATKLNKFAASKGYAGLYTQGTNGPIFLTISKGGFKDDKWSSQVALHEYSHHVLHALSRDHYPRWYDEGFANYLSTFNITGDIITIGAPKVTHGTSLKQGGWMSPEKVFSSIRRYPETRRIDKFYGQSWLYVHYMQNTPEYSSKFPAYIDALKTAQDPLKAFESSFGVSVEDYHKKARLYWNKNAFPVASFKAGPAILNHEMTVQELTDEELDLAFAKANLNFLDEKTIVKFDKKLEKLQAKLGKREDLTLLRSEAAMLGKDYKKADHLMSELISTAGKNSNVLRLRADIAYHKLWTEQFEGLEKSQAKIFQQSADLQSAIQYFEDALIADKTNKTSNLHMLDLLGRSQAKITAVAMRAVERTNEFYLKQDNVGEYLSVANVLARAGKMLRACDNYRYAKGRIDSYDDKDVNDDFARLTKFEQDYPAACT